MTSMTGTARAIFEACEAGKAWEGCKMRPAAIGRRDVLLAALLSGFFPAPLRAGAFDDGGRNETAQAEAEVLLSSRVAALRQRLAPEAPKLRSHPALVRIARLRARALAHGAPFSHEDFEGHLPAVDMVKAAFGPYGYIGENIAMESRGRGPFDARTFAEATADSWAMSEEHRANIVSPHFDAAGIGVVLFRMQSYAVQVFRGSPTAPRRPRSSRIAGAPLDWTD